MDKEIFLSDVMHEINMLKSHATQEELSKLNFSKFDPAKVKQCIYGQMTGSCMSRRAKELMDVSCKRVMNLNGGSSDIEYEPLDGILQKVNGEYTSQTWGGDGNNTDDDGNMVFWRNWSHLSSLEGYILSQDAKIPELLSYLKGETDTLTL